MANFQALVTLQPSSGVSRDVFVTSLFVDAPTTPNSTQYNAWGVAIKGFFDDQVTNGTLRGRAQNGHTIKYYAADGSVPNYPFAENTFNLASAPGAIDLPLEVSLCVSYANDSENSVPRARRRGRIYISGWQSASNSGGRPTAGTYQDLAANFNALIDDTNAITDFTAGVYSRVNGTVYPIERIWCDNEWDTMRSRGGRATARETILV